MKRMPNKTGWIYFIVSHDQDAVKIGYAENVQERLAGLQTGNPASLSILDTIPAPPELERTLHYRFREYRIAREWFRLSEEILGFVDEIEGLRRERVMSLIETGDLRPANEEEVIDALEAVQFTASELLDLEVPEIG